MADSKRSSHIWGLCVVTTVIVVPIFVGLRWHSWPAAILALVLTPMADVVLVWAAGFMVGMVISNPPQRVIEALDGRPPVSVSALPSAPAGGPDPELIDRLAKEFDLPNPSWQQFDAQQRLR